MNLLHSGLWTALGSARRVRTANRHRRNRNAPVRRAGFTLIELLVVIAIITVLIAILVPILWSVRQKSRQTVCVSNLMQLGKSIQLYADNWDDTYPDAPGTAWANSLSFNDLPITSKQFATSTEARSRLWPSQSSYLRDQLMLSDRSLKDEIFQCPNDAGSKDAGAQKLGYNDGPVSWRAQTSYLWNPAQVPGIMEVEGSASPQEVNGIALGELVDSSQARLLQDYGAFWHTTIATSTQNGPNGSAFRVQQGLVNAAFADGHVRSMRSSIRQPIAQLPPPPNVPAGQTPVSAYASAPEKPR